MEENTSPSKVAALALLSSLNTEALKSIVASSGINVPEAASSSSVLDQAMAESGITNDVESDLLLSDESNDGSTTPNSIVKDEGNLAASLLMMPHEPEVMLDEVNNSDFVESLLSEGEGSQDAKVIDASVLDSPLGDKEEKLIDDIKLKYRSISEKKRVSKLLEFPPPSPSTTNAKKSSHTVGESAGVLPSSKRPLGFLDDETPGNEMISPKKKTSSEKITHPHFGETPARSALAKNQVVRKNIEEKYSSTNQDNVKSKSSAHTQNDADRRSEGTDSTPKRSGSSTGGLDNVPPAKDVKKEQMISPPGPKNTPPGPKITPPGPKITPPGPKITPPGPKISPPPVCMSIPLGVPHLEVKVENLELGKKHHLETMTNFDPEVDLSGELTPNGISRGVWIKLRHFSSGPDVFKFRDAIDGHSGGFLGPCVVVTNIRHVPASPPELGGWKNNRGRGGGRGGRGGRGGSPFKPPIVL